MNILDKYEYNIKAEQILKLIDKADFLTAAKIADSIDWKRVRNVNMLANVGRVYAETGRYGDAKEIYQLAYERAPINRRLAYKLTEVSILAENYSEAEHYYDIFVDLAPRDSRRYELQYKMAKKKGEPIEKLIEILKEYKKTDFEDAWAYELARLYHKAGMGEACVAECDEIILWFGEGTYVEKAMELKMLYTPLSLSQQEKYNKRYQPQMRYSTETMEAETEENQPIPSEKEPAEVQDMPDPQQPVSVSTDIYNTANIQAVLAESMKELMKEEEKKEEEQSMAVTKDLRDVRRVLEWNNVTYSDQEVQEGPFRVQTTEPSEPDVETESEPDMPNPQTETQREFSQELPPEFPPEQQPEEEVKPVQEGRLSDEYRQIFAAFLHINGLEAKLAEIFEEAEKIGEERDTSLFGNILVIGDHKSGKTTLATEVMKCLSCTANRKNRRIAKISGDRLNNKGMKETIARLKGADLLIESAGEMNHKTMQDLLKAMEDSTGGMVVVLEDTQEGMTHLLAENPEVEVRFTHKLILKEYEISEWVQLAKQYAQELDYGIDEMATLALSAKIDALYAQKRVIELDDVKNIIDVAIEHSERKNIKKLFETVFSRKYKDSDLTMLRENDFV